MENINLKVKFNILKIMFLLLFFTYFFHLSIKANERGEENDLKPKVLILYNYSNDTDKDQEEMMVRILDMLVGCFTDDITVCEIKDFDTNSINNYSHIFFQAYSDNNISKEVIKSIENFKGSVFGIYKAVKVLNQRFNYINVKGEDLIVKSNAKRELIQDDTRLAIVTETKANVLLEGNTNSKKIPLLINNNTDYYFALASLYSPISEEIREVFYDFFDMENKRTIIKYIRLEDIHPKSDVKKLKRIAKYLKKNNIPYLATVIPVYVDKEAGKEIHLIDNPKLVRVLRYMQENGCSIILHGYTHQYRDSETGEGFEFWDSINDRPIICSKNETGKTRNEFNSDEEYNKYVNDRIAFEEEYINNRITKGIQELVAHRIYPLAFEAPHYAMSHKGYKILSKYFSTYVGHIQPSNKTMNDSITTISSTTPSFTNGLKVIPETLGYIIEDDDKIFEKIRNNAQCIAEYSDAYLGVFYHPYLGLDGLIKTIESLNSVSESKWLDLKNENNQVKLKGIMINSDNGKINVKKDFLTSSYELKVKMDEYGALFIVIIIGIFIEVKKVYFRKKK